ncbi:MAG: hypothetical protein LBG05_09815 [Treponema sp.]|jgi:hypothetical protein|nr:hypothetical protein [Treponema sp.]
MKKMLTILLLVTVSALGFSQALLPLLPLPGADGTGGLPIGGPPGMGMVDMGPEGDLGINSGIAAGLPGFHMSFFGIGGFSPFSYSKQNDKEAEAGMGIMASVMSNIPYMRVTFQDNINGKLGAKLTLIADADGDLSFEKVMEGHASLWVRPWDWIKLTVGRFTDMSIAGPMLISHGINYSGMGDDVFYRFGVSDTTGTVDEPTGWHNGVLINLSPIPNLYAGLALQLDTPIEMIKSQITPFDKVFQSMQLGIGYNFREIGLARIGLFGADFEGKNDWIDSSTGIGQHFQPFVQAAFKLTAVNQLAVDFGISFPMAADKAANYNNMTADSPMSTAHQSNIVVAILSTYVTKQFGLLAGLKADFGNPDKYFPMYYGVDLDPFVKVGKITVGGQFGFGYYVPLAKGSTGSGMKVGVKPTIYIPVFETLTFDIGVMVEYWKYSGTLVNSYGFKEKTKISVPLEFILAF